MQITPELIKYLESLARITLTEEEEKKVGGELQDILTYISDITRLYQVDFLELAALPEFQDCFIDELEFPEIQCEN